MVDGKVAGHISIVKAHDYLENYLTLNDHKALTKNGYSEVGKFFVDPLYRKHGIGKLLFEHVREESFKAGYQPALAVVDSSEDAVRFYRKAGMEDLGYFNGFHGKNFVFAYSSPAS